MLKPDDARRELAPFKAEKHHKARIARLTKLPKSAAAAGMGLFRLLPNGKQPADWSTRYALQNHSQVILGCDAAVRKKVLTALYPTFIKQIELGIRVLHRLPYTTGYNRRPYRAPSNPELFASKIGVYIASVDAALGEIADDALTPEWVAAWAVHLSYDSSGLGYLLAAQIDAGRDDVLEILKDSAANRHTTGGPGAHAIRGLLCCQKPEAWEFVANLLLAAQRQEGLRQVILEAVDEADPKAFHRLLGIVIDQNLIRFAAVARAAGVWLGETLMVEDAKALKGALGTVREYLDSPSKRTKPLKSGDAASLYRALWTLAFEDVARAATAAKPVLKEKNAGRKIAAIKLLGETNLKSAGDLVLPLLDDPDPSVLSAALTFFTHFHAADQDPDDELETDGAAKIYPPKLFEKLEKILPKLPEKPQAVASPVPTWPMANLSREIAANLLVACLHKRPAERLLPWMKWMSPRQRVVSLAHLCTPRTLTTKVRATLMACAAETNTQVREAALGFLKKCKLVEDEVRALEGYLTRKQPDFRRGIFELLLNRPDKLALESVERLLPGDALQRAGGIELARRMVEADRLPDKVQEALVEFLERKGAKVPEVDREAIDRILHPEAAPPTLENGLGLFDPKERSPIVPPKKRKVAFTSAAAVEFLKSLDHLIHENRDRPFRTYPAQNVGDEVILGSIQWSYQFHGPCEKLSPEDDLRNLALADLWMRWWDERPKSTRDDDGLELVRACLLRRKHSRDGEEDQDSPDETLAIEDPLVLKAISELHPMPPVGLRYGPIIETLLQWYLKLKLPANAIDHLLDAAEHALSMVPQSLIDSLPRVDSAREDKEEQPSVRWRSLYSADPPECQVFTGALGAIHLLARMRPLSKSQAIREYQLLRWLEEPAPGVQRDRIDFEKVLNAYENGTATLADYYDHIIGPRFQERYGIEAFDALRWLTNPRWLKDYPLVDQQSELKEAEERVIRRIIEIEIQRGETPTAATEAATTIGYVRGIEPLFPLVAALGKSGFAKSGYRTGTNRPEVLTHLIQTLMPLESDTPDVFRKAAEPWIASGRIPFEHIVELGLVNPTLISHVAAVINWPGYEEACYWFMAHSAGSHAHAIQSSPGENDDEHDKAWRSIVKARSNLSAEQRADGVIDVDWFHKAYRALDNDGRWDAIERAARFLGYGHAEKKAARLADVLLGRTKKKDLVENIQRKFLKESVRLLGLLPLPEGAKKRDAELADRYKVLKSYERYARGLSSLSKEPAMQSYRLGMENLAVTAGYADPVRLEWAVTAKETADLASGPVTVKAKDITLSLKLGHFAEPETMQFRGKEELKSLPKEAKANKAVEELLDRKKDLKRLVSSTKRTLELAMCAGDRFTATELQHLMAHPLVRPFVERLVLKTDAGMGYPARGGQALRSADGATVPVKGEWSIAHPLDFVNAKKWPEWQAECFRQERIQPFKQVFREVYTLTPAEMEDGDKSRRYSGQQVNENQAKALLSGRGWSTKEDLSKLYRADNLTVELLLDYGYTTPGDAAAPAVKELRFARRGEWKSLALSDIPPVIFSEVMRDLDLVVSVAHVGGVDPEATQSTVAMRFSLLEETRSLLKLDNVKLDGKHALIEGDYGHYSVHLGSGVVHKQPGGSLCVVAVNAQHRGRLFLPFADDDPRTAEVVSKVLLLARDKEIQDPTILAQIAAR